MITADDVTVVIPSLPDRNELLRRAVRSVEAQTVKPAGLSVHVDRDWAGAHTARNEALRDVKTEWVAFLDDDDWFHPDHLETLIEGANWSGADLVGTYPEPSIPGYADALQCCDNGKLRPAVDVPWGADQLDHFDARKGPTCPHCGYCRGSFITFTNLVRMDKIREVGGVPAPGSMGNEFAGWQAEDYLFLLRLLDAGARFHHVVGRRTWTYQVRTRITRPTHPVDIAREAVATHKALQKGGELASFLALAADLEPKIIVEIGADAGGTLWAWQQLPSHPRVIGISLEGGQFAGRYGFPLDSHGCQIVRGDSHDSATFGRLLDALGAHPVDILFIDGDHTFAGVRSDFEMYADLVRPGGVIAFHDICDHPTMKSVNVKAFWDTLEWEGDREEIITDPTHWGGIGVLRVPEMVMA